MADTGAGASLTLGTTGSVGTIRQISIGEFTIDTLDASDISSSDWMQMIPTDLADPPEISAEILWDGTETNVPSLGVAETITVTFPKVASTTVTAATFAGTGFITSFKLPDLEIDEIQVAEITCKLNGGYNSGTVPTWTAES